MMDEREQNQWTVETLREYLLTLIEANETKYDERFEAHQTAMQAALMAQKLAVDAALASSDRAVTKAEMAAEKRFEAVNEFRKTLSDQQMTFMARSEILSLLKNLEDKLTALQTDCDGKIETQRITSEKTADVLLKAVEDLRLAMTHLLSLEAYETRHTELQRQVNELREDRSANTGRKIGNQQVFGYWIAATSIVVVLLSTLISGGIAIAMHFIP